jgi:hypothetical protein
MANLATNLPVLNVPIVDSNGNLTVPWLMFLVQIYQRTGADQTPALSLTQVQALALINLIVATANGFAGTVSVLNNEATITLKTTVTGIVKGNGNSLSAAISGTDYAPATSGTSILKGNGSGGFNSAISGTDYAPPTSGGSILYGNGAGGFSNVTIGTNLSFTGGTLNASSSMVYPGAGIPNSTGSAWGTSYSVTGTGTNVVLDNKPTIKEPIIGTGFTVATLPAGSIGMRSYVTDALAPVFLAALTGGGAVKCPVFHNGTAWVAG